MEVLRRTNATGGMVWLTFTPINGRPRLLQHLDDAAGELAR